MYPKIKQYPREVTVKGRTWKICFVKNFKDPEPEGTIGICWKEGRTIYIKLGLSAKNRFYTFIHEVIHAVHFEAGVDDVPEKMVIKLEEGFAAFFIENFMAMCLLASAEFER